MKPNPGARGFSDWRFWAVLALYFVACLCFSQSAMRRLGEYAVLFPALMAYITMTTLAWEYKIIGDPRRAHALVLHIAFGVALFFFYNRVLFSFDESVAGASERIAGRAVPGIPYINAFFEIAGGVIIRIFSFVFSTAASLALFFMLILVFAFRRRWALPLFATAAFLLSLSAARAGLVSFAYMGGGVVLACVALCVQLEDLPQSRFWREVLEAFQAEPPQPRSVVEVRVSLLKKLAVSRILREADIRNILSRALRCSPSDPGLAGVAKACIEEFVAKHECIALESDASGSFLAIGTPGGEADFFTRMACIPKGAALFFLSAVYILSPVDLIPDPIPLAGMLDDFALGIFAFFSTVVPILRSSSTE